MLLRVDPLLFTGFSRPISRTRLQPGDHSSKPNDCQCIGVAWVRLILRTRRSLAAQAPSSFCALLPSGTTRKYPQPFAARALSRAFHQESERAHRCRKCTTPRRAPGSRVLQRSTHELCFQLRLLASPHALMQSRLLRSISHKRPYRSAPRNHPAPDKPLRPPSARAPYTDKTTAYGQAFAPCETLDWTLPQIPRVSYTRW